MKEKDFIKKYREETERIVPSNEAKRKCREAMEASKEERDSSKVRDFFRNVRPALVPAMCLVLVSAIVLSVLMSIPSYRGNFVNLLRPDREMNPSDVISNVAPAESYKEIYKFVKNKALGGYYSGASDDMIFAADGNVSTGVSGSTSPAPGAADNGLAEADDVSTTNTQVEGVDEGDIIKTDGEYIWTLQNQNSYYDYGEEDCRTILTCYRPKGAETEKLYTYEIEDIWDSDDESWYLWASEMYLTTDKIVVVGTRYDHVERTLTWGGAYAIADCCFLTSYDRSATAVAVIFDRDENGNITFSDVLGQTGDYSTSRLTDGRLEFISTYGLYGSITEDDLYSYVPTTYNNGERTYVAPESIIIGGECDTASYVTVTSIDIQKNEITDSKTVIGSYPTVYADATDMLLAIPVYDEVVKTVFTRLVFADDGSITVGAEKTVNGSLLNQFSMDHYNGYFRIAMTVYGEWEYDGAGDTVSMFQDMRNCLIILDENLETVGTLSDIAPGERIYSVRFSGDMGYFVTFYQTDPLFAVDLSDPASPKILDELKMPGYSAYLHKWSEDLLFGFGVDGDTSGRIAGLKLSMYKTDADGSLSTVVDKHLYESCSNALYDHKALLISPEKGLIGFSADNYYCIYRYEDGRFEELIKTEFYDTENRPIYYEFRGAYIGNSFYVWCSEEYSTVEMKVFSLDTFELLTEIK